MVKSFQRQARKRQVPSGEDRRGVHDSGEGGAATSVEGVATHGGFSAFQGERDRPGTVKRVSFELGGRPGP